MKIFIGHKPDRQHIQALAQCKRPENAPLLKLIAEALDSTKTALVTADDQLRIHRLQGRAEVLRDFLEAVDYAFENHQRL